VAAALEDEDVVVAATEEVVVAAAVVDVVAGAELDGLAIVLALEPFATGNARASAGNSTRPSG